MFGNAQMILDKARGRSALVLLLAAAATSRPRLAGILDRALGLFARAGAVNYSYKIGGAARNASLRLAHRRSDLQSALELAVGDCYQLSRVPAPDLIVDAGANVGLFTLAASALWPDAVIVVVEPSPDNLAAIRRNLAANQIRNRIEFVEAALTETGEDVQFYVRDSNQGSLDDNIPYNGVLRLHGERLSDILRRHRGSKLLLKLDIEGSEIGVLRECRPLLETYSEATIVLELHNKPAAEPILHQIFAGPLFQLDKYQEGQNEAHYRITKLPSALVG